jgi:hypothetical protein
MEIDSKLQIFRKNIRKHHKVIIDSIITSDAVDICIFCGSAENLTKEHVIPKWAFGNQPDKFFDTTINDLGQTYNRTTVSACSQCNSELLSSLEYEIVKIFREIDLSTQYFSLKEQSLTILWLELIEFKFHTLNMKRKFLKSKNSEYIPSLADFPISILQDNASQSPSKVFANIRKAHKRLSIKSKDDRINALVVFETKNNNFHFFHKTNQFIFLELADYGIALFYFFNQYFKNESEAHKAAREILDKVY